MPLALAWWRQLLVIAGFVAPITMFWTLVAVNALYPGWWALAIYYYNHAVHHLRYGRAKFRIHHGLCLACGYNLRGNLTGTCPECGSEIGFIPPRVLPSEQ